MTDAAPTNPPDASESAEDDSSPPPPPRSPYRRERAAVGAIFFAIAGGLSAYGALAVHRETFRIPAPTHAIGRCVDEISTLFQSYARVLGAVRPDGHGGLRAHRASAPDVRLELSRLDEALLALRPHCHGEGERADRAYTSLTLWRHLAEGHAHLGEVLVTPHAERALDLSSAP